MAADSPTIAEVLLPLALDTPYSYLIPRDMKLELGSYVQVPLGPRQQIGVVWSFTAQAPAKAKLREISDVFDLPPLTANHRRFVDWLAAYYLEPRGNVLRMVLRAPGVFAPAKEQLLYRATGQLPQRLTPQRQRVLAVANEGFARRLNDLAEAAAVSPAVIKSLVKDGALEAIAVSSYRPFSPPDCRAESFALSPAQTQAAAQLCAELKQSPPGVSLLDGVTGSGKTEVYFEAMAAVLAQAHSAEAAQSPPQILLLLPEIALTTGFIERVERRFGAEPARWHSEMTAKERERVWQAVAQGEAQIVVGARSGLFLPWRNLQLIIVDEEHETSYKQEEGVPYHARDMAVLYGNLAKFPVILSSATPSLESLVNVDRGRYAQVALADRFGRAELPALDLVDMREATTASGQWLSVPLIAAVQQTLADGNQALLFINRRGYAPLTLCRACGHHMDCPHCSAALVEHRFRRQLMCHHCGHVEMKPDHCPACGAADKLVPCGPGIERLAEEAAQLFPEARQTILSSDLMRGTNLRDTLREIEQGRHNLILGTQLVAKGHHFPNLTLVGVVDGDLALESTDPRGAERTFALMAQVAGRAGRSAKPGRALIQTYLPDHPLMQALKIGSREKYLAQEKLIRSQASLPPYGRLAAVIVSGPDAAATEAFARHIASFAPLAEDVTLLGPAPAPLTVIRGRHRWRFLVKTSAKVKIQAFLQEWLKDVKTRSNLSVHIDIDPYSFL